MFYFSVSFVVLLQFDGVLGVLFGVSFVAGGITNLMFYNENSELWSNVCEVLESDYIILPKVCQRLAVVYNTELACTVSWGC